MSAYYSHCRLKNGAGGGGISISDIKVVNLQGKSPANLEKIDLFYNLFDFKLQKMSFKTF